MNKTCCAITVALVVFPAFCPVSGEEDLTSAKLGIAVINLQEAKKDLSHVRWPDAGRAVLVYDVLPFSPADTLIPKLTIVTKIGGRPIPDKDSFNDFMKSAKPGTPVKVIVRTPRDSKDGKLVLYSDPRSLTITPVTMPVIASRSVETKEDEFYKTKFCRHKGDPGPRDESCVNLYFQESDGKAHNLRIVISLTRPELFVLGGAILKSGERGAEILPNGDEIKREESRKKARHTSEWFDVPVTRDVLDVISAGIESGACKIRYRSPETVFDRDLSEEELLRMRMVLLAFKDKKGEQVKAASP